MNIVARIVSIFKSGDKCNVNNFRPISIISVLPKLFEKLICIRLGYFRFLLSLISALSRAFDTINNLISLDKQENVEIRGIAGKWFTSYLENQLHYASIGEVKSEKCTVRTGLPQGSNLTPIPFSLWINNIYTFISATQDTTVILKSIYYVIISTYIAAISPNYGPV